MNTEKLDKLEQQIQALQVELEKARAECKQQEKWPNKGDICWSFIMGGVYSFVWYDTYTPLEAIQHRIFRTKEEAQAAYAWTFSKRAAIRREVELCEGFSPSGRYVVDYLDGEIRAFILTSDWHGAGFTFKDMLSAGACIDKVGEDKLRYLLTGEE